MLFFGDSLVAGVGDPAGGGWVARVVAACADRGTPLTAYNMGIRRETSLDVAARWRAETAPRIPPGADARIVWSFGANDTTVERGVVRVDADRSRRALDMALEGARALGFRSFVVGPAPVDDESQNERIVELSKSFARVCAACSVPFVAVSDALLGSPVWRSEIAAGDGAHPEAAGYDELTRLLVDGGLLEWLCQASAPAREAS